MTVYFVLPGDIDEPAAVSGGNVYDRQVIAGLAAMGTPVREVAVAGAWPRPSRDACAALTRALDGIPDGAVVVLDGLVACGVPDVVVPHALRLRLVVLVHLPLADEVGLPPETAAELDHAERQVLAAARAVVATSRWAAQRLERGHGLAAVHAITPGVAPARQVRGSADGARLLCVASVTRRKGHDVLVSALATLADLEWTCVCAGPDDRDRAQAARVRLMVDRAGLTRRVRFLGARTGEALAAEHAAADLLVLPSRAETYGMVVTEAIAHGIPVLASAVGGVPDAMGRTPEGVPGMLVPPDDERALADALRRWLGDDGLRRRLRARTAQRRTELPTWEDAARDMAALLSGLRP